MCQQDTLNHSEAFRMLVKLLPRFPGWNLRFIPHKSQVEAIWDVILVVLLELGMIVTGTGIASLVL